MKRGPQRPQPPRRDAINVQALAGAPLPGLPGHTADDPSPSDLTELDQRASRLLHAWHQWPEAEQTLRYRGVSIGEAIEYHTVGRILLALADLKFQGYRERLRPRRS